MFDELRAQFFPYRLDAQVSAIAIADSGPFWAEAGPLMQRIFPPFHELGGFGLEIPPERGAKLEPLAALSGLTHQEQIVLRTDDGTTVGYFFGNMREPQTFFMISTALLPQYRRQGLYSRFTQHLLRYLYAVGYERVQSLHHANNRAVLIAKLKLGFNITGLVLDERMGAHVELTYFFHEDRRLAFARAFSMEQRDTPLSHIGPPESRPLE
jgi:GNAT superfamily N-acetyltransferase